MLGELTRMTTWRCQPSTSLCQLPLSVSLLSPQWILLSDVRAFPILHIMQIWYLKGSYWQKWVQFLWLPTFPLLLPMTVVELSIPKHRPGLEVERPRASIDSDQAPEKSGRTWDAFFQPHSVALRYRLLWNEDRTTASGIYSQLRVNILLRTAGLHVSDLSTSL